MVSNRQPSRPLIDLNTVISGSYRKHLRELMFVRGFLAERRINVLSPVGTAARTELDQEFVLLDGDPIDDHRALQDSIFAKIRVSSFLVVANVGGYIGAAATLEIGYAVGVGVRVLTTEPVSDPNLAVYAHSFSSVFEDWPVSPQYGESDRCAS